jgi:hypothetical protein
LSKRDRERGIEVPSYSTHVNRKLYRSIPMLGAYAYTDEAINQARSAVGEITKGWCRTESGAEKARLP